MFKKGKTYMVTGGKFQIQYIAGGRFEELKNDTQFKCISIQPLILELTGTETQVSPVDNVQEVFSKCVEITIR
jgi:hypothetical protein